MEDYKSNFSSWHNEIANNNLAHLPPMINSQDSEIQRLLESCDHHLNKLKDAYYIIGNPEILVHTLGLKIAKASCHIENIITTNDALYTALSSERENQPQEVRDVFSYHKALFLGFNKVSEGEDINIQLVNEIASIINEKPMIVRFEPNFIFSQKFGVVYTPPDNKQVIDSLLYNLFKYYNDQEDHVNPLLKMAIAHHQFESIHPYMDGNGRTGRILNLLYLCKEGIIPSPVLTLSNTIAETKDLYYKELNNLQRTNTWENWLCYMLSSLQISSIFTYQILGRIKRSISDSEVLLQKGRFNKALSKEVTGIIYFMPYFRKVDLCDELNLSIKEADEIVSFLVKNRVLKYKKIKDEELLINTELKEILLHEVDILRPDRKGINYLF